MAAGRRFLRSTIFLLVYVFLCWNEVSSTSYSQLSADLDCRITFHGYLQDPKRNISFSTWTTQPRGRRYLSARIPLYPNHEASFTRTRISISGDVQPNPGPNIDNRITTLCSVCQRAVRSNNRALECDVCKEWCHIKCGEISLREYRRLQNIQTFDWTCPSCRCTLCQLIRRDRTKCKGGGVALYHADHLTTVHRKDLLVRDIEAIWVQVKFPAHSTLFSVVCRSELETPNFFEKFHGVLERA